MLPPERCDVAGSFRRHGHAGDGLFEVAGVPQDDGGYEQVEAGGAVGLVFEPAVPQFAELIDRPLTISPGCGENSVSRSCANSASIPAKTGRHQPVSAYRESVSK